MFPFSFSELVSAQDAEFKVKQIYTTEEKGWLKGIFSEYVRKGGIPEFVRQEKIEYLQSLYESILYRDVITKFKASSEKQLKELVFFLASHMGQEMSYNSLRKILGIASANTLSDYCQQLMNCYLCFLINRYDFSLKRQILFAKKNYFIDHALARAVGFYFSEDTGRILENMVFVELRRTFTDLYFHKKTQECDFIVRQGAKIIAAIQVCAHLENEKTRMREINGLLEALQMYQLTEGFIITEDTEKLIPIERDETTYQIRVVPIWKWLLQTRV